MGKPFLLAVLLSPLLGGCTVFGFEMHDGYLVLLIPISIILYLIHTGYDNGGGGDGGPWFGGDFGGDGGDGGD